MAQQIQLRRDSAADWTSANPTLAEGEVGVETDTAKLKIGDGSTAWTSLGYFSATGAIRVEDEGSSIVAAATGINFVGSGVTVTDAGSNEATVTISSGGSGANLTWTASTSTVASDSGTDAVITAVDGTNPGLMTVALKSKLDGIEAAADVTDATNVAAAGALMKVAAGDSVENIGAVESNVQTVAATGSTETLDTSVYGVFDMTMDQNCTFTFSNPAPSGKATIFTLILRGAFTPTWPAAVDWPDATQPTYTTPTVYTFMTVNAGTTWLGASAGKAFG